MRGSFVVYAFRFSFFVVEMGRKGGRKEGGYNTGTQSRWFGVWGKWVTVGVIGALVRCWEWGWLGLPCVKEGS